MRQRALVGSWIILCVLNAAHAAIPGAELGKTPTEHDAIREDLAFNQKTLAEAYKAVGRRNPKWDAQAIALLDAMAKYFAYANVEGVYEMADTPSAAQILKLSEAAVAAGCNDPLVQDMHGIALYDNNRRPQSNTVYRKAAAGMIDSKYPAFRIATCTRRASRHLGANEKDLLERCKQRYGEAVVEVLGAKIAKEEFRIVVESLADLDTLKPDEQFLLIEEIEQSKEADPYVVDLMYGRAHVSKAWEHRGSGWAHTVKEEGWKGFHENLGKARDRLTRAHNARPDLTLAAVTMIKVAMGGSQLNEQPRDWFDKAVAARVDCQQAYNAYSQSILPRWGGDYETMYAFGVECLQTKRYDTMVPFYFLTMLQQIDSDSTGDGQIYRNKETYAALKLFFTEVDTLSKTVHKNWYRSKHLAIAWKTGRYDDAIKLLDGVGDKVEPSAFGQDWAQFAVSELHARKSNAADVEAVLALVAESRLGEAIKRLQTVEQGLPKDHPARLYVRYKARQIQLDKDLAGGAWATITAEDDLVPWQHVSGDWKVQDDDSLLATSAKGAGKVFLPYELGDSFEIKLTMNFPSGNFATTQPAKDAGPVISYIYPMWLSDRYWTVISLSTENKILRMTTMSTATQGNVKLAPNDELLVRVTNDEMTMLFNGQQIGKTIPTGMDRYPGAPRFGLGLDGRWPERSVQFSNIQVRRLPGNVADEKGL